MNKYVIIISVYMQLCIIHICYNETIHGVHFNKIPDTGDIPLVADMSSCILSEEVDVSRFALIYAGAQKNIAPSGMTIVIIREDLIGNAPENCPVYLDYKTHADKGSMYNTPPCFTIYIAGEVFKHILAMGGVGEMHERDVRKAEKRRGLSLAKYHTRALDYPDGNPRRAFVLYSSGFT